MRVRKTIFGLRTTKAVLKIYYTSLLNILHQTSTKFRINANFMGELSVMFTCQDRKGGGLSNQA